MVDIFFSYSHEDEKRIRPLVQVLEKRGWSVFWDRRIPAGKSWRSHIGQALEDARCVVVVWSKHSIESSWVGEEADEAKKRGTLLPILIDPVDPPIGFRSIQAGNLSEWEPGQASPGLNRLIQDIDLALGVAAGTTPVAQSVERVTGIDDETQLPKQKTKKSSASVVYAVATSFLVLLAWAGYWGYQEWNLGSSDTEQRSTRAPIREKPPEHPTKAADIQKPFIWVLDRTHKLKVVDFDGRQTREIANNNIDKSIGGNRVLSASRDGKFAVVVNAYDMVDKLARYDFDGSLAWSIKSGKYIAVDVADTGYSYAIKRGSHGSGKSLVQKIDNDTGVVERQVELSQRYFDIVVDERNETVWVGGQAIARLDLDLNETWTRDPIEWYVVSIDYAPDGSLLAAEREYAGKKGENRLLIIGADGNIKKSLPLSFSPARVVASRRFVWEIWVVGKSIARFNLKGSSGDIPEIYDFGKVTYADISRDGTVWIAANNKLIRLSRQGTVKGELRNIGFDKTCLAVVSDN